MSTPIQFEVVQQAGAARLGRLTLACGVIDTPVFMPVGTLAAVKALDPRDLEALGAKILLANAYHLLLRPGARSIAERGGLHRFMAWGGGLLTDSGGYQVFSLSDTRRITDEGVTFRSHIDGTLIELTPERLVEVQEDLGPNIAMVLDECPPPGASREQVGAAVVRTTAWAARCLASRRRRDVALFGITQGGVYEDLRCEHAEALSAMDFDGYAIGGVSVGEPPEEIARVVDISAPCLPPGKPRYLMGVGTPADLVRSVASGVDMFDCVLPTRNARNGQLFTSTGRLVIKNSVHRQSDEPIDPECDCYTCRTFSRAYLRHLYVAGEIGYHRLATLHNVRFYLRLMEKIRQDLERGTFAPEAYLARL